MDYRRCIRIQDHMAQFSGPEAMPLVSQHASALGNAPSYELFDLVKASPCCGDRPPRALGDYAITVGTPPQGVTLHVLR